MRKLLITIIAFLSVTYYSYGQAKTLIAEGTAPHLYLVHKVEPKENFYSIGRDYNVSPKEIAPFNNLVFEKGLSVGQIIKIPLSESNFLQDPALSNTGLLPIYHIVQAKEGLYRVSTNNKVPMEVLKKWNNLHSDVVSNGTKLIVGYLNLQKGQTGAVTQVSPTQKAPNAGNDIVNSPVEKKIDKVKEIEPKKEPVTTKNVAKTPGQVKTPDLVKKDSSSGQVKKDSPSEVKGIQEVSNKTPGHTIDFKGGSFRSMYNEQVNNKKTENETGLAAVFKTTSGWQDGKYYCFHNTAAPGTIIKITNSANGKIVYAKVLDAIPDIKQNSGLLLRISNAAAEELGATESKFDCSITYFK